MLLYLVTYDVSCNRRRRKISDLLEGYGQRVQWSVFECQLSARKYQELRDRLQPRVQPEDSIRFYPISGHTVGTIEVWGSGPNLTEVPGCFVV
jgi:CRISPR-associated protein Cas2